VRAGRDGTGGNPAEGSGGPLSRDRLRRRMPSLRIGVPPGTVVKRGAGGRLLGELLSPGASHAQKCWILYVFAVELMAGEERTSSVCCTGYSFNAIFCKWGTCVWRSSTAKQT